MDEWKGVALTWWSVDGKLCSKLFKAHQALREDSKVGVQDSKVGVPTVKSFYEAIGMKMQTFYNFINRTKKLVEAGADIENMSESMTRPPSGTGPRSIRPFSSLRSADPLLFPTVPSSSPCPYTPIYMFYICTITCREIERERPEERTEERERERKRKKKFPSPHSVLTL